jgi:glucose-6-phosphate 1-epimerase
MEAEWRTGFKNGLAVVELTTASSTAVVALQGAQVLSFVPRGGRDWLWVSERARWGAGAALRGGIPICFPWFGPHPTERGLPAHGFARTRPWRLTGVAPLEGGRLRADFALDADEQTSAVYPHAFEARLAVIVGDELMLVFEVGNLADTPLSFEVALHTYLSVSDVGAIAIAGLSGATLIDKAAAGEQGREGEAPVRIIGEVDRVYDVAGPVTLLDPAERPLRIQSSGAGSTVVWNPAPAKTATLADMAPEGYRRFVCIETGALGARRVVLGPDGRHRMVVGYSR